MRAHKSTAWRELPAVWLGLLLILICSCHAVPMKQGPADTLEISAEPGISSVKPVWYPSQGQVYGISDTRDDGTQVSGTWYQDGYLDRENRIGYDSGGTRFLSALRFEAPELQAGQRVQYARLTMASAGGVVLDHLSLTIAGVLEEGNGPPWDESLPSDLPLTEARTEWKANHSWISGSPDFPMYYSSPNIADIVTELLAHPGWGQGRKNLAFLIQGSPPVDQGSSYVKFYDCSQEEMRLSPVWLEIYPTVGDAFMVPPMLGRPTDTSITINAFNLLPIDIYAEYGKQQGDYQEATPPLLGQEPQVPMEIVIEGLSANTTYFYRLRYRQAGTGDFIPGYEGSFQTQRAPGTSFVFDIQADSHAIGSIKRNDSRKARLYEVTLENELRDQPDFFIDMGDFAHIEFYATRSAASLQDAVERYLIQRHFLGILSPYAPFYLVLGNHEGEQGWRIALDADSVEVVGTLARKELIPNPYPDGFYTGSTDSTDCCGQRENYYAWQWGDALLVVLDPYWYTTTMPHIAGLYVSSKDGWDWTLGKDQYDWLYRTLHQSQARWKFVFSHQVTGGLILPHERKGPYGRGGIDAASFRVAGRPTFEWGGEDSTGAYVFDQKRPGWDHGPVHRMMAEEGVDIFFHGHDHAFVYEELDGVVYQACPTPSGTGYDQGYYLPERYSTGIQVNNSGHLRVSIYPDSARIDYVRSVLPEDEPLAEDGASVRNGDISYSYTLKK